MLHTIQLGAYGWRHKHWSNTFYPDNLPTGGTEDAGEDWRLTYYSNEFDTVLVPADYWQAGQEKDSENWLASVHSEFRFFVECRPEMFEMVSLAEFTVALEGLLPQLSALVFPRQELPFPDDTEQQLLQLAESLQVDIIGDVSASVARPTQKIWQADEDVGARFAFIEDDLKNLRSSKEMVERFAAQVAGQDSERVVSTIVINHAQLQVADLGKFRAVLDIMGY